MSYNSKSKNTNDAAMIKSGRDVLADCLKGYACLLVLFGHVIMGVRKSGVNTPAFMMNLELFIWTFHVALFMFLSGYVYRITGEWKSQGTRGRFILHKLFNLGVPYFVFSTVYIVINSCISETNTDFNLVDILFLWKSPMAQYWFLYALFNIFVIFTILSEAMSNLQITVFMFLFVYIAPLFDISFGSFGTAISMSFPFGLGASLTCLLIDKYDVWKRILIVAGHVILIPIFISTGISGMIVLDEIEVVAGIFGSIALISLLIQNKIIKKFLLFVNAHSFSIYVLHTIFTAGVRIVLNRIGVENYWLHISIGTVIGLLVPVLVSIFAKKTVIFEFFFYPSRIIKKLKAKF